MQLKNLILDLGSRTAKLYILDNEVKNINNVNWEVIEGKSSKESINNSLIELLKPINFNEIHRIHAVGTEAMRRDKKLENIVSSVCHSLGILYTTISQEYEAQLIKEAARKANITDKYDIINVGGGSIQIILKEASKAVLLNFGISDLNDRFYLLEAVGHRKIEECIAWIKKHLPETTALFGYTGGEATYLKHFGVPLQADHTCLKTDFYDFAERISNFDLQSLERVSPFGSKWMRGAVASNCVVLACLEKAQTNYFLPSDLNISHGLIEVIELNVQ
ncbi:hypothetical protein NIES4072_72960 [Nostoc commune NIES-4072]|uniref:Ppx/GppA phosphatase N-terminal domain-containing protein n=1 Tax=Nostoc commune NIES-4072 TaxID=2005467 RepID=A0A2R5G795_NOSCO|nr:exopolyphosphatase [Nostoc commune]BBD70930.1 hypothetical protein NIES4070_73410 [Nostoc commune HK-02]GBG23584.1 hypothetical protein NIES4072_72960 [Nostoc commune NIES-4072]